MRRPRIQDFRVALQPGVVDCDSLEAPFLAIAHQLTIIAVHQERVFRSAAGTFSGHEMLRHDIGIKFGRVAVDLDLEITRAMSGIERTKKRQQRIQDRLATSEPGKINPELSSRRPEIQHRILSKGRGQ